MKFKIGDLVTVKDSKQLRRVTEIKVYLPAPYDPPIPNALESGVGAYFQPPLYYRLDTGMFWPEPDLERAYA